MFYRIAQMYKIQKLELIRQIFCPCLFDCLFVQIQTKIKNNNKKEQNENENEKQRHLLIDRKNDINANSSFLFVN